MHLQGARPQRHHSQVHHHALATVQRHALLMQLQNGWAAAKPASAIVSKAQRQAESQLCEVGAAPASFQHWLRSAHLSVKGSQAPWLSTAKHLACKRPAYLEGLLPRAPLRPRWAALWDLPATGCSRRRLPAAGQPQVGERQVQLQRVVQLHIQPHRLARTAAAGAALLPALV